MLHRYAFGQLTQSIATWLHTTQLQHILTSPYIGVTCDESTDRCRGKHMMISATFIHENRIVTEFLALLTVEKCEAASLLSVFVSHLQAVGIELAKIVGMSTDGASVMRGSKNGLVARLRLHIPHLVSSHCIAHRYGCPRSKRCSGGTPRVRHGRRADPSSRRVSRGIHQVRWLSRGNTVMRTVMVSPALIVMLHEWDKTLYELATSYRFHFFLADMLEQLNVLNKSFQQREETHYVECGDDFGGGLSARLSPFIMKYGPDSDKPEVTVQGVESNGRPTTHKFQLHENPSEDYPTLGTHDAYVDLCTSFAETLVSDLSKRFEDLDSLVGVSLFMPDEYPPGRAERHKQCLEWLMSLVSLFRAQETDHILLGTRNP
ncbi:unnamed protein product [Closterium sp. NIES-53]